jgi:hypothetical protein
MARIDDAAKRVLAGTATPQDEALIKKVHNLATRKLLAWEHLYDLVADAAASDSPTAEGAAYVVGEMRDEFPDLGRSRRRSQTTRSRRSVRASRARQSKPR